MSEQVTIRYFDRELDTPFVFKSWLKNYYDTSYFCKRLREVVFYQYHHKLLTAMLDRPSLTILIAHDPTDENVIWGFLAFEKYKDSYVIHYIYVKSAFRGERVASSLLKASGLDPNNCMFSHWTKPVDELIKKFPTLTYVPYLI